MRLKQSPSADVKIVLFDQNPGSALEKKIAAVGMLRVQLKAGSENESPPAYDNFA